MDNTSLGLFNQFRSNESNFYMNESSLFSYKKSPYRSVKHNTYFQVYDRLLQKYRGKEITFVEIGVLGGGSLFMWRDFFGPRARIIGVDLNPDAKKWEALGFEIFIGSQSDEIFWNDFVKNVGSVDVVLDDGGHTYEQQIVTTECLLSNINDGGMLVVEDTHTSYQEGFGFERHSFINYVKRFIDKINMRFSGLDDFKADKRVWSIEVFESIVAFNVNRLASCLESIQVDNGGFDDRANDFRYKDNVYAEKYIALIKVFSFLKQIPGAKRLRKFLFAIVSGKDAKISKYFN